jgi:Protein of unknown function (DUF3313)
MFEMIGKDEGHRSRRARRMIMGAVIVGLTLGVGCAPLRQRREAVKPSGFLGDYSQLAKSDEYPAYLVYINPSANWSSYNAIMIDSVSLWGSSEKLSPEDRQMIAGMMYNALYDTLSKNFAIVAAPGVNVLRLRAAITEARGSKVALNVVTSVVPQLRVLTTVGGMAADTATIVGEASGEIEVTDSVTGRRLAAGVDRQTGTKALLRANKFSKWGDVKEACERWAENLDKFLVKSGVQQKMAQ